MISPPFYLNCMDPGHTTGLGLLLVSEDDFTIEETASVLYKPESNSSPLRTLKVWRKNYTEAPHILVYENFTVRPGRMKPDTTALEIIGSVQDWANGADSMSPVAQQILTWVREELSAGPGEEGMRLLQELRDMVTVQHKQTASPYMEVISQEPVQAKNLITDPVLERMGLKMPGHDNRHINDAFRHAAAYLAQNRYMPVCSRGWPRAKPLPHAGFTSERER